jgi:hypothetical protein
MTGWCDPAHRQKIASPIFFLLRIQMDLDDLLDEEREQERLAKIEWAHNRLKYLAHKIITESHLPTPFSTSRDYEWMEDGRKLQIWVHKQTKSKWNPLIIVNNDDIVYEYNRAKVWLTPGGTGKK